MRKASFLLPIILGVSACGMLKSEAKKAEETYERLKGELSAQEQCTKLTEISELYYKENDIENYTKWNRKKSILCNAVQRAEKSLGDLQNSVRSLNQAYDRLVRSY